tara:strand:- start:311 stop:751 length:441 start_codon:yes stop_codon:yes gene_type:complete
VKKDKIKPFILYVAEVIYFEVINIKKNNPEISNVEAIELFIGSKIYNKISSGKFHDDWFNDLKKSNFIDKKTGNKIPMETLKLLNIQRDSMVKQLIRYPNLYYAKSHFPLEISQRAFDHLWRICESYELWCKETNQNELIHLNVLD